MPAIDLAVCRAHLQSKWTKACPMCDGFPAWAIHDAGYQWIEFVAPGPGGHMKALVVVPVTCRHCGFVAPFDVQAVSGAVRY